MKNSHKTSQYINNNKNVEKREHLLNNSVNFKQTKGEFLEMKFDNSVNVSDAVNSQVYINYKTINPIIISIKVLIKMFMVFLIFLITKTMISLKILLMIKLFQK